MTRRRIRRFTSSSPERDENGNRIRSALDASDAEAALAVMATHYGASGDADQTNTSGQRAPKSPDADADAALQSRDADRPSPSSLTSEPARTFLDKRKDVRRSSNAGGTPH
jgi:hypothetical protein